MWEWQACSMEEGGPVNTVEFGDVFANYMDKG
jgi:hypothetical protein